MRLKQQLVLFSPSAFCMVDTLRFPCELRGLAAGSIWEALTGFLGHICPVVLIGQITKAYVRLFPSKYFYIVSFISVLSVGNPGCESEPGTNSRALLSAAPGCWEYHRSEQPVPWCAPRPRGSCGYPSQRTWAEGCRMSWSICSLS